MISKEFATKNKLWYNEIRQAKKATGLKGRQWKKFKKELKRNKIDLVDFMKEWLVP